MPRTASGSSSLNLFGIKAGDEWTGGRATRTRWSSANGVATPRRTAFRAYGSIEESVSDFANLLKNSPRYPRCHCGRRRRPGVHPQHGQIGLRNRS